jgi:hypothetical protein
MKDETDSGIVECIDKGVEREERERVRERD